MATIITDPSPGIALPRIRGSLGEKVLRKSPELFNQGLSTVLAEALQNARRAGATRVEVELLGREGHATLLLRDDGCGIADMASLVTFGSSAWDERTDIGENAAGMGVFSLASRGVTVRSRGQRVTLGREVFCGEAEAIVLPDSEAVTGTELLFPVPEPCPEVALRRACRFYPLPVTLNGKPLEQSGFLDGAAHLVEWQGLRLGVFRDHGPKVLDLFDRHRGWDRRLYLNFHGHVVECHDAVRLTEVGGVAWSVFVDVVRAPDLRLVLPARNEPINNDFFRALRGRAERGILECIARQPRHSLAFKDAERAAQLGIALPPVEIRLDPWCMASDELQHRSMPAPVVLGAAPAPVLLLDVATDTFEDANLHVLLAGWQGGLPVVQANTSFAGYPAYDALPVISGLAATVTELDGTVREVPEPAAPGEDPPTTTEQSVVAAITVRLLVRNRGVLPGDATVIHAAGLPFFFTSDCDYEFPGFVVAKGTDPGRLADALVECFFVHSDDADANSYDSQLSGYAAEARDLARTLLLTSTEALVARIVESVRDIRWSLRPLAGGTVEVRIADAVHGTIRVIGPDGQDTVVPL